MPFEVAVLGSGPGGATAARLLAEWGHSVLMIAPAPAARTPLAESIPPSAGRILGEVGALALVDGAGFLRTTGNTSWWGSATPRVEGFEGSARGWQVLRSELESVLRGAAVAAGVALREARATGDVAEARHVLDASGRAGVLAGRWRLAHGPATLAVSALFSRRGGFAVQDDSHTLVESHAEGWAWSVPVAVGLRHVTVMLDRPARGQEPRDLEAIYARELSRAPRIREMVDGAQRQGAPWADDVSAYTARPFSDGRTTLVGDAASFIDPLSSFGVKKALFSGWLAAVATHTAARHPERAGMAAEFYCRNEQRVFARYSAEVARYASEAAGLHPGSRFWSARAAVALPRADDEPLAPEPAVRRTFDAMKARERLRVRLAESVRMGTAPAIEGHEIVSAEALVDGTGRAVAFVDGVSAPVLARLVEGCDEVGRLYEAYNAVAPRVALGDLLRALATLVAAGLLRERSPAG